MNTTMMKNKLFENYTPFCISQTVYLHTQRTTDIDDVSDKELEEIYAIFFPKQPSLSDQIITAKNNEMLRKHKSIVLTIATRIGLKEKDCWAKFNRWMLNSSVHKKRLNDYDLLELQSLEKQLRAAERNYNQSASKAGNKAWYEKNNFPIPSES